MKPEERKIGRNNPCWCGSGKKFKKCHLDRDKQEPVPLWQASDKFKESFGVKYCVVPDELKKECDRDIIKAHTVSKSGSLKRIARDGHVYALKQNLMSIVRNEGIPTPELVGINNASTFTGFCGYHDKIIFAPLEDVDFTNSLLQCFLLGYRAVSREYFQKKGALDFLEISTEADKGFLPIEQQEIQALNYYCKLGFRTGLRNIETHKSRYENVLLSQNYNNVFYYSIMLQSPPDVMCSGGIFPECDFEGNKLQDLDNLDLTPDLISFSSFATSTGGAIVFSWLDDSNEYCTRFLKSLHKIHNNDLPNALVRFTFEFFENILLGPNWWDNLDSTVKSKLIKKLESMTDPFTKRKSDCLKYDGIAAVEWNVLDRKTNCEIIVSNKS